jgi:uridine kinase
MPFEEGASLPNPSALVSATQDPALVRAILAQSPLLRGIAPDRIAVFHSYTDLLEVPAGTSIMHEGEETSELYILLEGEAQIERKGVDLGHLGPGDHFGELGLIAGRPRAASIRALSPLRLVRLTRDRFDQFASDHPALALSLLQAAINLLGHELTEMTDNVGQLLKERSLPRRSKVQVRIGDVVRWVKTGTSLRAILPAEVDGRLVVAGLIERKPVTLNTPVSSDSTISPLTTGHWEGRKIYRRSVGLLLIEAAYQIDPSLEIRLGPAMGAGQLVEVSRADVDKPALAAGLLERMRAIAARDATIRVEWWTLEEARSHFQDQGWSDATQLLRTWRHSTVRLMSCGSAYALVFGPLMPSTGAIRGFDLMPSDRGLLLLFGDDDPGTVISPTTQRHTRENGNISEERARDLGHEHWLRSLGITCVGAFNDACVSGQVSQLIRVSEGFHEKRIGQIADRIAQKKGVRVICIAGPSSSGKTTFIKRMRVQLQINGFNPVGISLDDYYVDRELTVRDANGEFDFEALDALDLPLLHDHLRRLQTGAAVKTARYNFTNGKSSPTGGPVIQLGETDILMLEGIHGLNPRLLGDGFDPSLAFRIFIHPMTALPFDRVTRVSASDLRLLRRIVRDRHHRGYSAADNIMRWPSVRAGERHWIFPHQFQADAIFDSALIYELSVLKVYADRYLLEMPGDHPAATTAYRLRQLLDRFVTIYPEHVPPTSILREFIGGSGFEY